MAEKDRITEMKVKHSGLFDFREAYSFLYTLLTDMGYGVEEKVYSEKTKGDQKDIEITWAAKRSVSDYFRFEMKVDFRIMRMVNVDVTKDGVKASVNKGDFEVKIGAFLERDYESRWENTAFLRFLRGIYDKYVIKSTREGYEDKVYGEAEGLTQQLKAYLALAVA